MMLSGESVDSDSSFSQGCLRAQDRKSGRKKAKAAYLAVPLRSSTRWDKSQGLPDLTF